MKWQKVSAFTVSSRNTLNPLPPISWMGFCSDVTELDEMNRIREEMINRLPTATEKVNNIDGQNG